MVQDFKAEDNHIVQVNGKASARWRCQKTISDHLRPLVNSTANGNAMPKCFTLMEEHREKATRNIMQLSHVLKEKAKAVKIVFTRRYYYSVNYISSNHGTKIEHQPNRTSNTRLDLQNSNCRNRTATRKP
ncbi:hypothetical protein H5410_042238 [Solanum commersonii]|uniref:Uncharacterized protein n=1 Tax=Solanum commersonii TaxID=4109 RepID=A0A9J5XX08_SOLCO|nr:hypothetical protein H5410_042238 [Solanum commersonii]